MIFVYSQFCKRNIIIIYRQMIRHLSHTNSKDQRSGEQRRVNEFETFQVLSSEANYMDSNKDSLLFSQSRKADETNRQIGQIIFNMSKQQWREYQQQRSRGSSIIRNKYYDTIKQTQQPQSVDPLTRYMISPFDLKQVRNHQAENNRNRGNQGIEDLRFGNCERCRSIQEIHKRQLAFLTKNNQQLYQLNKELTDKMNELVIKMEGLQQTKALLYNNNSILKDQIEDLKKNCSFLSQKYFQREERYILQKQMYLKSNKKQLQIVEKISECLKEKEKEKRSLQKDTIKEKQNHTCQKQKQDNKRAKTQYIQEKHKHTQTMATWQGSNFKYTPRKVEKCQVSVQKMSKQIDQKVSKLSHEKKRNLDKVAKQALTIQALYTEIPQSALDKMAKIDISKHNLVNSSKLGKSISYYGNSLMQKCNQRKYR